MHARGVTKHFDSVMAVEGIDLTVKIGTVHGIVGPNGAGKTTVLSMIFGLTTPDSGVLRVLDQPTARHDGRTVDGVAGCVEMPRFYPYLSARRNLALLAGLDGAASRSVVARKVDEVLWQVGLGTVSGDRVREYSLGMRQRLGIAAALLRDVRLLVLDEPSNGLDLAGVQEVRALLTSLAQQGVAVLLSSHHIKELEEVCDAVTILRAGHVVFDGSMQQMRRRAPDPQFRLHSSDDVAAQLVAERGDQITLESGDDQPGFAVRTSQQGLDAYVMQLVRLGIAIRGLQPVRSPLESLFLELTTSEPHVAATAGESPTGQQALSMSASTGEAGHESLGVRR